MSLLNQLITNKTSVHKDKVGFVIIQSLDRLRSNSLKLTLKNKIVRYVYTHRHLRIGILYIFFSIFNFLIALNHPELLLVFGPLIYGYLHLISSYHFIQQPLSKLKIGSSKVFTTLCILTLIVLVFKQITLNLNSNLQLASGGWELIASTLIFVFILFLAKINSIKITISVIFLNSIILFACWNQPLNFVSGSLFVHNWVAFIYWIISAKDRNNLFVAISSTLLFGFSHIVIMTGFLDSFISNKDITFFISSNVSGNAWILAPWSHDPIVWQRALTLYSFGLAMHYFVWLKAIPENTQKKETPHSFKLFIKKAKVEFGPSMFKVLLLLALAGTIIWLFSFEVGATIYFLLASLHIWLEINFLLPRFLK